ncbi:MAG: ferric reductase [Rhodospirillaceae bacterium]|nr:ferric reductase [Rhodospirillaceae bacterium]
MRTLKVWLWAFLGLLTVLWAIAASWPETSGLMALRKPAIYVTGLLAICAMSFAMVLALRPVRLESWLGGLDKSYRLHKWLGITALVTAVAHWLVVNAPKWAVSLGLMERPKRGERPDIAELPALQQWFDAQRHTAESIGEWAFYGLVALIALALIKRFPYRLFAKTHTIVALVYLALAVHSVILMDFGYWTQPVGLVAALLMAAGTIASVLVLTGRIGHARKTAGTIEDIDLFPDLGVVETSIRLEQGWQGHQAGQFAFVTFDPKEGAHPFTIASAWKGDDRRINFITKGLGDYTDLMADRLKVGDKVIVEGPYGRFIFSDGKQRQIWIGGGIGITPFIARMKQLALAPHDQVIDLYHATQPLDPKAAEKLTADAKAANVRLHLVIDGQDSRLTGERLRREIPDWTTASIWFCGPAQFGHSLRTDLVSHGLKYEDFHQELFNLR